MTRRFRQLLCQLLLGTLLFTQWAVASYACPAWSAGTSEPAAVATMADCEHMGGAHDSSSPNLCIEHCQPGQQSVDRDATPSLTTALLASFYPLPFAAQWQLPQCQPAVSPGSFVAASPPHEILHCCFRI